MGRGPVQVHYERETSWHPPCHTVWNTKTCICSILHFSTNPSGTDVQNASSRCVKLIAYCSVWELSLSLF